MRRLLIALTIAVLSIGADADPGEAPDAPTERASYRETPESLDVASVAHDAAPEYEIDMDNLWVDMTPDEPLVLRFAIGILRSRVLKGTKNKIYWERCGEPVEEENLQRDALMWASVYVDVLDRVEVDTGVRLNAWGPFATMANEGGFNECSLNYAARKWASEHTGRELITETWKGKTVRRKVTKKVVEKFRQSYDRDTVWRIIHHPDYATATVQVKDRKNGGMKTVRLKNKFDGGVWQIRKSVKKLKRSMFDDLTSVEPGVYLGAMEMVRRAKNWKARYRLRYIHPRPWKLWPGAMAGIQRIEKYDKKITSVARWLGATRDEIQIGYVAIDGYGKVRKRATAPAKSKPVRASVDKPIAQ